MTLDTLDDDNDEDDVDENGRSRREIAIATREDAYCESDNLNFVRGLFQNANDKTKFQLTEAPLTGGFQYYADVPYGAFSRERFFV